ncbi:MAG: hypothetical protein M1819_006058 [Sarea resinae]|nr:MAG: hypothetical protein M1819_006058 [Sarea resinae]
MLLPRLRAPGVSTAAALQQCLRRPAYTAYNSSAVASPLLHLPSTSSPSPLSHSSTISPLLTFIRHASHQAQGRANGAKDGPGKRLGAKKSGDQLVIPGNIIFRQRGTHWFPGENVGMGRDHTIYSMATGYVKYYRDPAKHPKRQYIGVVFSRQDSLPTPLNAARKRRLGMLAVPMTEATQALEPGIEGKEAVVDADLSASIPGAGNTGTTPDVREVPAPRKQTKAQKAAAEKEEQNSRLVLRPGYMYREANWEIGRVAEKRGVSVRQFKAGDRYLAWRKTAARKARNAERRGMRRK